MALSVVNTIAAVEKKVDMKKTVIISLVLLIALLCVLVGCDTEGEITCYVPDGAPALAVAKIIADGKVGDSNVTTYVTTGEDVVAKCASGEADMAILPSNAAVKICSDRNDYRLFSVNVFGLLYVVGTRQVASLAELCENTVYSIGLGNTPEYVMKKILDVNGVSYADTFEYITDGTTAVQMILGSQAEFALLGEPAVTNLIQKAAEKGKTVYRLFDLQQLWQQATDSSEAGYPQAALIVKNSLLTDDFAHNLQQILQQNTQFLLANLAGLNDLLKGAGSSLDVSYTAEIIARCNVRFTAACEIKNDLETYLATFQAMQKFLPLSDDIFYEQNA